MGVDQVVADELATVIVATVRARRLLRLLDPLKVDLQARIRAAEPHAAVEPLLVVRRELGHLGVPLEDDLIGPRSALVAEAVDQPCGALDHRQLQLHVAQVTAAAPIRSSLQAHSQLHEPISVEHAAHLNLEATAAALCRLLGVPLSNPLDAAVGVDGKLRASRARRPLDLITSPRP